MTDIQYILPQVIDTARDAGIAIMRHYKTGNIVYKKDDSSPVTEADRIADRMIVEKLALITPDIAVVSEEGDKPDISGSKYFWLVDPLDGTKSFIRESGYFTVNIALINNNKPVAGVIYEPVNKIMYYGSSNGAFREHDGITRQIHVASRPRPVTAIVSHSHINKATEDYLQDNHIIERIPCASSIKFCFLAEGMADIYPRFGPTMEWDIAAGHAILEAAGGKITTLENQPFLYGKEKFLNGNFLAMGKYSVLK